MVLNMKHFCHYEYMKNREREREKKRKDLLTEINDKFHYSVV